MKEDVLQIFGSYPQYAFLISIGLNILVAVLGIVPSVFITAANIYFFGFWPGTAISFAGESIGAFIAFILYRYGLRRKVERRIEKYPRVSKLIQTTGREAFMVIVSLRLIPFIPSGIITFAAAMGKVSMLIFLIASSLGKLPALLIEAYAVYNVTKFNWQGKAILLLAGCYFLYLFVRRKR